jgi:hypothetical protein
VQIFISDVDCRLVEIRAIGINGDEDLSGIFVEGMTSKCQSRQ